MPAPKRPGQRQATASFQVKRPRGRKKKSLDESDDDSQNANMIMEDDEEDIQGQYVEEGGTYIEDIYIPPRMAHTEPSKQGERLVIEKIVCENFKSYAGVKEMGPFHKSFSAIVGPNGNGKSNIIDAMLFVFGYRAAKIRCKKVSVLIHKSELLPNLRWCAVSVHFVKIVDNGEDDGVLNIIDKSRIIVQRVADVSNNSNYYLQGRKVKFQDVAAFLKESGIDIVHNRFLILQGEVESISQLKPRATNPLEPGLLEFLEEVIGSRRYLKCLVDLQNKVESLDQERDEKLQRVDLVEKEKNNMKEPVKKAKEFLADQNKKTRYQHQLSQVMAHHSAIKKDEVELEKNHLQSQMDTILARLSEIKEHSNKRKAEVAQLEKEYKKLESEYLTQKSAFEKANTEHIKCQQKLKTHNEERKKLQKSIVKCEMELKELKDLPEKNEFEMKNERKKMEELELLVKKKENAIENDLKSLKEESEKVAKRKEAAAKEFTGLSSRWNKVKKNAESAAKELNDYINTYTEESAKLEKMKQEYEEMKNEIIKRQKNDRSSLNNKMTQYAEKVREIIERNKATERKIEVKKIEVDEASMRFHEATKSMQGAENSDRIHTAFFDEKKQGRLNGLYGRFKDLVQIPERYNVAATISTNMLEYWIVDNDTTASECINFLKAKNLPFQTFVCLNKMERYSRQMKEFFECPKNSERIFDLLKISKKELAPVYYKGYSNTLVCDDLDIAQTVAYGKVRQRVVTLDGSLIEKTGSMAGGGKQRIIGRLNTGLSKRLSSSQVSQEDLAKMKKVYDYVSKQYEELVAEKNKLAEEQHKYKKEITDIELLSNNFKSDTDAMKNQMPLKQKRLKDQEEKTKNAEIDENVLQQKKDLAETMERNREELKNVYETAEKEMKSIQSQLNECLVDKPAKLRAPVQATIKELEASKAKINKLTVDIRNASRNTIKITEKLEVEKKEIESIERSMDKLMENKKEIEASSPPLKIRVGELKTGVDEAKTKIEEQKLTMNEFSTEENSLKKQQVKIDNDLGNILKKFHDLQNRIKSYLESLNNFVLKEIPEEEIQPFKIYEKEEIERMNPKEIESKINKYTQKLSHEAPNLLILEEYKRKVQQYLERVEELDNVTIRRDKFRDGFMTATAYRLSEFMHGYSIISAKVKEIFRMISMGGDAELELVDSTDPFVAGIEYQVRPKNKTWKKISNLSGGEKTLSSLALVFALHHFKPSPFYVMDEIDAALDYKNVSIIANYVKDRTKFTQFIIISLRSNMFELADSLIGVYKVDNMSYCMHIGVSRIIKSALMAQQALEKSQQKRIESTESQPPQTIPERIIETVES